MRVQFYISAIVCLGCVQNMSDDGDVCMNCKAQLERMLLSCLKLLLHMQFSRKCSDRLWSPLSLILSNLNVVFMPFLPSSMQKVFLPLP